jgi:signal transduction histidine kinase
MRMFDRLLRLSGWMVVAALAGGVAPAQPVSTQSGQKQVLVLYTTRRDAQLATVGDRELPRIIESGLATGVDYYSEYLDRARSSSDEYLQGFRNFLQLKYEAHRFDIVIAMDTTSLEFVEAYRSQLFAETPLIFFSDAPLSRRPANSTGVIAELNLAGTLTLAKTLQPDIRNVFVVNGTARSYEDIAQTQFRPFEPQLSITYLSGLPTHELENRLRSLPAHSIVYYLVVGRDGAGQNFHPLEYLERVAAVSNAATYCWVDSAMDRGVVGGSLRSQMAQADAVGALANRVLRGERADDIPVVSTDLNVNQVDWRQLQRWRISEARVPPGTLVKFRQPSLWDQYRLYFLTGIAILLAQSALIIGLLLQHRGRRQAEEKVRGGEAKLRKSHQRIRDLGVRLLNAQEAERSRIARELHDDISQQLALLSIDLELMGAAVSGDAERMAQDALKRTNSISSSVHDLSHRLHPARLRLIGLVAALQGLQKELPQSDIAMSVTHDNVPSGLPPDLTLCLFRVAQEALQNAIKYSKARQLTVHLDGAPDQIALTIVDDGVGFDVDAAWGKGLGLVSMSERLEAIGGQLDIRSKPGAGTLIQVKVPLPAMPEPETVAV